MIGSIGPNLPGPLILRPETPPGQERRDLSAVNPGQSRPVGREELTSALRQAGAALFGPEAERREQARFPNTNVRLSIAEDEETGRFVFRTVDRQTGEVLRQWPEEEILEVLQILSQIGGLLVDREV